MSLEEQVEELTRAGTFEHTVEEALAFKERFLDKLKSKDWFLEIGVRYGGSSRFWQLCGFKNGIGIEANFEQLRCDLADPYFRVEGKSFDVEVLKKFRAILGGNLLDFLYIDGNHDYRSVRTDYELYSPFVREGGVIGFHDLKLHPRGVWKFFNEVRNDTAREIDIDGTGIGAFFK